MSFLAILLSLFVTPSPSGQEPVIAAIQGAQRSVRMTMFHLTHPAVTDALIAAHARGVDVEVILDGASLKDKRFSPAFDQLSAAGVAVRASSPAFSITHEKALVVDSSRALILSLNLTMKYDTTRDFGVETSDPAVVSEMLRVFDADWSNAAQGTGVTPRVSQLVWSPVNSRERLSGLVDSAVKTLDLTVENLGDPVIQASLANAAARGVRVRLIVPMCDQNDNPLYNYPFLRALASGGVQARVMPYPADPSHPYMHAKTMIADGARAYLGSVNYSVNSTTRARELGLIFSDASAVGTMAATFEEDWGAAVELPAQDPASCPRG